jgi:hypothetical protein
MPAYAAGNTKAEESTKAGERTMAARSTVMYS